MDCCKTWTNKCNKTDNISNISDILSIIAQENRLQIICLLNKNKELCVCEIIPLLWLKQNLVSHHLSILHNIWILQKRKDGKKIYYSINQENYNDIVAQIKHIFNIN